MLRSSRRMPGWEGRISVCTNLPLPASGTAVFTNAPSRHRRRTIRRRSRPLLRQRILLHCRIPLRPTTTVHPCPIVASARR